MGVSLERVQNKFACIIGELCSEPVVLSQFAIWLDLRLAEYKLKGAISLECSGDNPDPIWLKGHTISPPRIIRREINPANATSIRRNSPADVVVKEEPPDSDGVVSVFPVGLIRHDGLGSSRPSTRKRSVRESNPSEQNLSQSDDSFLHQLSPSSKVRRVASPCESEGPVLTLEPVSESLMSIISRDQLEGNSASLDDVSDGDEEYDYHHQQMGDNSEITFSSDLEHSARGEAASQVEEMIDPDRTVDGEFGMDFQEGIKIVAAVRNQFQSDLELGPESSAHLLTQGKKQAAFSFKRSPRKQWSENDMEKAIAVVMNAQMTISSASRKYQIPRTTLYDRLAARDPSREKKT